jgi:hypothetical protein
VSRCPASVGLTPGATYYWRAQASDTGKGVTSAYSTPQMFYGTYFSSTSVSGVADAAGRLTGTVRGKYDNEGFPSYVICNVQLGFVLAPH